MKVIKKTENSVNEIISLHQRFLIGKTGLLTFRALMCKCRCLRSGIAPGASFPRFPGVGFRPSKAGVPFACKAPGMTLIAGPPARFRRAHALHAFDTTPSMSGPTHVGRRPNPLPRTWTAKVLSGHGLSRFPVVLDNRAS